jgi:hypothetical protein
MSLMSVDPELIGATFEPDSVGETVLLTPGAAPIHLTALQVCACCSQPSWMLRHLSMALQPQTKLLIKELPAYRH